MAVTVTIEGVTQTTLQPGWNINATANGLDSFSGTILSLDASNRPAVDDVIVITEPDYPGTGTMRIFGGVITSVTELGFGGVGASTGILTRITAQDFNQLATRRTVYGSRPAETLAARLTWLVATYLTSLGGGLADVTLSGSQATGPTLAAHDYNYDVLTKVFDDLTAESSGYLWNIDYSQVLLMALPGGGNPAPFDLTESGGVVANVIGDIEVTPTRDAYANRVILRFDGGTAVTDSWTQSTAWSSAKTITQITKANPTHVAVSSHGLTTGQSVYLESTNSVRDIDGIRQATVLDGGHFTVPVDVATTAGTSGNMYTGWGQTEFFLSSVYLSDPGYLTIDGVPNVARDPWWAVVQSAASPSGWSLVTSHPYPAGTTIAFAYTSAFKVVSVADDAGEQAANGIYEVAIEGTNITSTAAADALAAAYLAQRKQVRKSIAYPTRSRGLQPGQTQAFTVPKRALSLSALITEVTTQHTIGQNIDRRVTAVEGAILLAGAWRDTYKQMLGSGSGAGSTSVALSVVTGGSSGVAVYWLGGNQSLAQQSSGPTWIAADVVLVTPRVSMTVSVVVQLRADAGTVTARLASWDGATSVSVGASTAVSAAAAFTTVTFAASVAAGVTYRLELLPSLANTDVWGLGYMESLT